MARLTKIVTLVANVPQQVSAIFGFNKTFTSGNFPGGQSMMMDRVLIQMRAGGTGLGSVYDGVASGVIPTPGTTPDAQLAPATAGSPGGSYTDTISPNSGNGINGTELWVSSTQADPVLISVDLKS